MRYLIIFMVMVINCSFKRIEGTFHPKRFFPFSDLEVIKPEYLDVLADQITLISLVLLIALEVKEREMWLVFGLFVGRLIDYLLEGGYGWFHLYGKVISFDSLLFVIMGIILTKKLWETLKSGY